MTGPGNSAQASGMEYTGGTGSKGRPHGNGTKTWADGTTYTVSFKTVSEYLEGSAILAP